MISLPIILDDLIDEDFQNQIEDCLFDCNWKYFSDLVLGSKTECKYREFYNPLTYDICPSFNADLLNVSNKKIFEKIYPLIQICCKKIKFDILKIERCYSSVRAFIPNRTKKDTIHVNRDVPHLVMLYYVNDSDGNTILYDKTIDDIPFEEHYPDEHYDLNITHSITPKKGRVLFFDGRHYHAPSSPSKSMRCVITLDLFGNFQDNSYSFPVPKIYKITYS